MPIDSISQIRAKRPEWNNLSDDVVVDVVRKVYFPNMTNEELSLAVGVKPIEKPAVARTWGEAASDTGRAVMAGAAGLVKSGGDLYGLASGDMENAVSKMGGDAQQYWVEGQSQALKGKIQARKTKIDAADSTLGKFGTAIYETITDPALMADVTASNVATLLPGAAVGRVAAGARMASGLNAARAAGPISLAAEQAIAKSAGTIGTAAAVGTGAAQQGADVSGDTYADSMKKTAQQLAQNPDFINSVQAKVDAGIDEASAIKSSQQEFATSAARAAFLPAAAISVAANAIPGGTMLERALVGGAARNTIKEAGRFGIAGPMVKAALGEAGQETVEEGGGAFSGNVAKQRYVDPNQNLMDSVGENAGMGAVGGLGMGAAGGAFHRQAAADTVRAKDTQTGAGPMTRAGNLGVETRAKAIETTGIDPNQPVNEAKPVAPILDDPIMGRIMALPQESKQEALAAYNIIVNPDAPKGIATYNQKLLDRLLSQDFQDAIVENNPPNEQLPPEPVVAGDASPSLSLPSNLGLGNAADLSLDAKSASDQTDGQVTPVDASAIENANTNPVAQLPKDLAGAKPNYSFGSKKFDLSFESDVDRAAYIAAQETPSKRDADYLSFAMQATGMSEPEVRAYGVKVRNAIKLQASPAKPGTLIIPNVLRQEPNVQNPAQIPAQPETQVQPETQAAPDQKPADSGVAQPTPATGLPDAGAAAVEADGLAPTAQNQTTQDQSPVQTKAIERIARGTAYFGNAIKAGQFISENGLRDTHESVMTKPGRFDVVAKTTATSTATPITQAAQPTTGEGAGASQPTQLAAIATPVQLGINNQPISEGAKPFKTRLSATNAKKLQPSMRVVSVKGGYVLAEKTDKQLAAEAAATRRLSSPQTSPAGQPMPAHAFIAAEGGLNADAYPDMNVGSNPKIGNRRLFAGGGRGISLENASARLIEEGYLSEGASQNEAMALIKRSLSEPQYNADGIERIAEMDAQAQFDAYELEQQNAVDKSQITEDSEFASVDNDIPWGDTPSNMTTESAMRALGFTEQEIQNEVTRESASASENNQLGKSPNETQASRPQEGNGQRESAPPIAAEGLTAPTEQEIVAQQDRAEAAKRKADADKRAADKSDADAKEKADIAKASESAADTFVLGGDALTNLTGQQDVFGIAPDVAEAQAESALTTTESQPDSTQIKDFGEQLPPARRAIAAKLDEALTDETIATQPFSKVWPIAENEAIEHTFAAALAHVARESVPAKPRVPYKVKSWVAKVNMLRELAASIVSGRITREQFLKKSGEYALKDMVSKVKLLEQLDRADWRRIGDVVEAPDALRYEGDKRVPTPMVNVTVDGKYHWFKDSGSLDIHFEGIKALLTKDKPESRMQFEIRQRRTGDTPVFINKQGDPSRRPLMEFSTAGEARKAVIEQYDGLIDAWEGIKARDNITERDLRTDENRPRAGKDWRTGKNVAANDFQSKFGFRGGEFGKWVSQGNGAQERQFMLNSAYDALMDLSDMLGIPPKAISLEGSLGLAFGSRGSGAASAHFEPSNLVINLTKPRGAGALAHEWFHALDNYFARKRGGEAEFAGNQSVYRDSNYITHKTQPMMVRKDGRGSAITPQRLAEWRKGSPNDFSYLAESQWHQDPKHGDGVRAEVEKSFEDLVQALNASNMLKRSRLLEGSKGGDGYWSRTLERAARSFENYVQTRMMEQGYHNDFLANVKAVSAVNKNENRYPYLLPSEIAPISQAFDNLFETIKTEDKGDGNVAMFSRSQSTKDSYEARIESLFSGEQASRIGAQVLDRSDVLDMLGMGSKPMILQESKVVEGQSNHPEMTAEVWKKIPDWIENPAAVFKSDTVLGRLVFIAPELVSGSIVRIIIEPELQAGGKSLKVSLVVNAYDATGKAPFLRWLSEGQGLYADKKRFPAILALSAGLQLPSTALQNKPGTATILTEKNLSGYRNANSPSLSLSKSSAAETNALKELSLNDSLFALPRSEKKTVEDISAETDPAIKVVKTSNTAGRMVYKLTMADGKTATMSIRLFNKYATEDAPSLYGYTLKDGEMTNMVTSRPGLNPEQVGGKDDVWIDVSNLNTGGDGAKIYNIAETFAHNTGRIFIGDPAGLTDDALRRRTEQMLSSALKFGTTEHLAPHPRQVEGDGAMGIKPLRWTYGDDIGNIKALIQSSLSAYSNVNPITFEPSTGRFLNSEGKPANDAFIQRFVREGRAGERGAGVSTIKRNAVLDSLVRQEGGAGEGSGQRNGLLEKLLVVSSQSGASTSKLSYSRADSEGAGRPAQLAGETLEAARATEAVERTTAGITSRWENSPKVVVAFDMQDSRIPEAVRTEDQKQRSGGAVGTPEGFYYKGVVYLMSSQLKTPSDIARVLFHEALGHAGLRGVFGQQLKPILQQIATLRRAEVAAKAAEYGLDVDIESQRLQAAEEVLAVMAQTRPALGYVKRAITAIRTWLRKNVPGFSAMKLTDAEIIQNYIVPARAWVERGNAAISNTALPALIRRGSTSTDDGLRLETKSQSAGKKTWVFDRFSQAGIESGSADQAMKDAVLLTGVDLGLQFKEDAGLADDVPMAYEHDTDTVLVNPLFAGSSRSEMAQWMAEEVLHALDSVRSGRMLSASAAMLDLDVGVIAVEAQNYYIAKGKLADWLHYPLGYDELTKSQIKAELFARLGVLYFGQPELMNRELPLAYEAYHGTFSLGATQGTQSDDSIGSLSANVSRASNAKPITEAGSQYRSNSGFGKTAGRSGETRNTDPGLVGVYSKLRQSFGTTSNGGLVQFGRSNTANNTPKFSRTLSGLLENAFNSAKETKLPAGYLVDDLFKSNGKLSFWHKTVGTQYNLAQRSPAFKQVFDGVQTFINDVSHYATQASERAPRILPKMENWRDIIKSPISAADNKAIAAPIFEGTLTWMRDEKGNPVQSVDMEAAAAKLSSLDKAQQLLRGRHVNPNVLKMWQGLPIDQYDALIKNKYERDMMKPGIVFTPAELKQLFNLTDSQIGLYQEFRSATDKSLTDLAIGDMVRFGGEDTQVMRERALESGDVNKAAEMLRDHLLELADLIPERRDVLIDTSVRMIDKADTAQSLMDKGYAPLSRFGSYSLDVVDTNGDRVYFGMFESQTKANKMARQMKDNFAGAEITQGTISQESFKLFSGVSPETLELFGEMLGLESQGDDASAQAFQQYIKLSKSNRSAMKRLVERKGIAGFSEDPGRVLAGFVYSNARQTSAGLHMGAITQAVNDIPKGQGELKDAAMGLFEYVQNPQEEAQKIRGLLFAQYLGGSIASAMVNLTQPINVSFPWLSQYGGIRKAARQMTRALADALKTSTGDAALDAALLKASEDGIVSPQEVFQLMDQAQGKATLTTGDGTQLGELRAKVGNNLARAGIAWGKVFSVAEQYNRRSTFIAAYRTAIEQGMGDPAAFAEKAVNETQFVYNKGAKPRWARGAVGGVLFTFKSYSINYVELLSRMASNGPEGRKAAMLALAVLFVMAGAGGIPFAEDIDDVIDGAMQRLGYNFNSKQAKQEFFTSLLGRTGADFVERGVSGLVGVPIDVSGRMGMGNLIPGTGLITKKTNYSRDILELFGPAGDLAKRGFEATGKALVGDVFGRTGAIATISPTAIRNVIQAHDMATTGMYRDTKGKKVIDVDAFDIAVKAIGFQPNDVAKVQEATGQVYNMVAQNKMRESEISNQWAQGIFENDAAKIQRARDSMEQWNTSNPASPIRIKMQQIFRRVKSMREDKETRIAKTAPKEIRAAVRQELANSR